MNELRQAIDTSIAMGNTTAAYVYARLLARHYLRVIDPKQYRVWRYHRCMGTFTFDELEMWMLEWFTGNAPDSDAYYRKYIAQCARVFAPYNVKSLQEVGYMTEEFHVSCIKPNDDDKVSGWMNLGGVR